MDIAQSTHRFEQWLGQQVELQPDELAYKHHRMASSNPFPFFRGTYYRWVQLWPTEFHDLQFATRVMAVGDLHLENFGTWRDSDARLVWGINDFDDADTLPWTNDLVRLAASVWFAIRSKSLDIGFQKACRCLLKGYVAQLQGVPRPFVLEETHRTLRRMAMDDERNPVDFWKKLNSTPAQTTPDVASLGDDLQATALATLLRALPATAALKTFHRRERIGMGSLGKPRFMVIGTYNGAAVAREAKSLVGPPTQWFQEQPPLGSRIGELLKQVVRAPDPMYRTDGDWIVRRLAPHCVRLELSELTQSKALTCVLTSMGAETANIHAGTPDATASILKDIERLPSNWLAAAAKHGAKLLMHDWKRWRQIHTGPDGDALAGAS